MSGRRLLPAADGEYFPRAGLTVLNTIEEGKMQRYDVHLVRYDCCGAERTLVRSVIDTRSRENSLRCATCAQQESYTRMVKARRDRGEKQRDAKRVRATTHADLVSDYGVTPPTWPKPPGAPTGYQLWCDLGANR